MPLFSKQLTAWHANGQAKTVVAEEGIVLTRPAQITKMATEFIKAIAQYQAWSREKKDQLPAMVGQRILGADRHSPYEPANANYRNRFSLRTV